MPGFDLPAGDPAAVKAASGLLGTVGADLYHDLGEVKCGVATAIQDWRGRRNEDFVRAAGGAQVQLKIAGDGCGAVSSALAHYATAFQQTCEDIAGLQRQAGAAQAAVQQHANTIGPTSRDEDLAFQHLGQRINGLEQQAADARSALAAVGANIAAAIDAETDKIVPLSSSLSPAEIRRRVNTELGMTGLSGAGSATLSTVQAWALIAGAERAIPAGAVNPDGSVDWSKAMATPAVPPAGSDPSSVASWWNNLSPAQQDALLNASFSQLGNLDGIPVLDRDFANRANLAQLQKVVQGQIEALKGQEPPKTEIYYQGYREVESTTPAWDQWHDKVANLQEQLDGLNQVQSVLAGSAPAPLFLIGLQNVGHGRAIISTGNPDTAANVSTYVPGMGTKLTGIGGGVSRSNAMYRSAQKFGSPSTAAVTWFGYDAPQGLGDAASEDDARKAAPMLDRFQNGLRATHVGGPSLNTVVAHSYGTTVTGMSASHGNVLNADNVVLVASPGVTVDHAGDLQLSGIPSSETSQHVYATAAQYDPIKIAAGINGPAPTSADFGAHEFSADPDRGHLWMLGWNPGAHSSYWHSNNIALSNMGLIIANHGDQTK